MKRCGKCDKSDHKHCREKDCECPCRRFLDSQKAHTDDRRSNPEEDDFFINANKEWLKIQQEKQPKKISDPSNPSV